jgi:flagellar motility protein MotE (MotC chaperone)
MNRLPRILPLLAVAAAGVLAIDALENGPGLVGAARSFAEGVAPKANAHRGAAKSDKPLPENASVAAAASPGAQAVAAKPAPICAESAGELAKDAGLSPAELQVLQSLSVRRGELDQRAQGLDTQTALLQAAEAKIDAKIAAMTALKGDMQGLLGQLDAKQQAEVDRLVKVFEAMKPQDAAARFVLLSDDVRLPIAAKIKERALSAMLAKMPPEEAKRLTESLAARYVAQADAARKAINPQAAAPAPAPTPAQASTKPAQLAQAAPATTPPPAATPAKPKPAHRKPRAAHAVDAGAVAVAKPLAASAAAAVASAAKPTPPASATKSAPAATAAAAAPKPPAAAPAPAKPAQPTPPAPAKAG